MIPSLQNLSASKVIIELWSTKYVHNKIKTWLKDCKNISSGEMSGVIGARMKGILYDWVFELTKCNTLVRGILSSMINPVGQKIFDWIQYYDTYVFVYVPYMRTVPWCYQNDMAVNYLDSLVWMGEVIDVEKTAKVLLSNENLTYVIKYHIACVHCLEDDIYNIASQVLNTLSFGSQISISNETQVFDTLTFFSFERQSMVYFWTAIVKNDFTIFQKEIDECNKKYFTDCTLNECVFQQVAGCHMIWFWVGYRNQIAIKYVWNYLSVDEKSRQIVFAINRTRNIDIKYFLMSQLTNEQKSRLFEDISAFSLLSDFWYKDCLMRRRFVPTVQQFWNLLQFRDFVWILTRVEDAMIYNTKNAESYKQYKDMFIELWQSAPNHLKKPYFENLHSFRNLFRMCDISNDLDIIKIMLCNSDENQIIPLLKSEEIVIRCVYYIISYKWDLLKTLFGKSLLVKILFPTEGVKQFEQLELESQKYDRAMHFIQNRDMVENFLKWSCNTDEEIEKIQPNLAFSNSAVPYFKKLLVANIETDYEEIEYFLIWCAFGDENVKEIKELKEALPDLCFKEVAYKLIIENKYDLLDKFLNWCFEKNEQKLLFKERLRKQFLMDSDSRSYKSSIFNPLLSLIEKNDKFVSLERFAIYFYHFYDNYILKDVISELKEHLTIFLLEKCMFKLANELDDWCPEPGVSKLAMYERSFVSSIFERCVSQENYKKLVLEALNWLSPTAEEVVLFKGVFKDVWWFELVLPILDNYEKEREKNQVGQNMVNK